MDIIFLSDLRIDTIIGINDWERKVKQTVVLDIEMATDIRKAASTESIKDTLDYKAVAKRLIDHLEGLDAVEDDPPPAEMDEGTRERLKALGYVK